jgi:hypothetical protein
MFAMKILVPLMLFFSSFIFSQTTSTNTNPYISESGKSFYYLMNNPLTMRWNGYVVEEKLFEGIYSNALLGKKYDPLEIKNLRDMVTAKDNIIGLFEYRTNFIEEGYRRMRENDLAIIKLKDDQIKAKETIVIVSVIAIPVAFILGIIVDRGINITTTTK